MATHKGRNRDIEADEVSCTKREKRNITCQSGNKKIEKKDRAYEESC